MNIFVLDASPLRAAEMPSTATGSTTGVRKIRLRSGRVDEMRHIGGPRSRIRCCHVTPKIILFNSLDIQCTPLYITFAVMISLQLYANV